MSNVEHRFRVLGVSLLGATPIGVRLGSVLAGALASAVLVRISGTLGGDRAALRAAAIIACMPSIEASDRKWCVMSGEVR